MGQGQIDIYVQMPDGRKEFIGHRSAYVELRTPFTRIALDRIAASPDVTGAQPPLVGHVEVLDPSVDKDRFGAELAGLGTPVEQAATYAAKRPRQLIFNARRDRIRILDRDRRNSLFVCGRPRS